MKRTTSSELSNTLAHNTDTYIAGPDHNDDRDLDSFEQDQIFRHQVRVVNEVQDIDPSDSDLEDDSDALKAIHDDDDIFALRRRKERQDREDEELLESSGDDLDRQHNDNLPI